MQASSSLWEQLLLNAVGPLVTVLLGSVAVDGTVAWLQRRREARQAVRDLTVEMFQVAYCFYVSVEEARRRRTYGEPEQPVEKLDEAFQEFAVAARSVEARLRVAGSNEKPVETRGTWHCVLDLLTLLYYHQRQSSQRIQDLIAGQQREHVRTSALEAEGMPEDLRLRFLEPGELKDADKVKARYADAVDELISLRG